MTAHEDLCACGVIGPEPTDCAPDCICQPTTKENNE